MKNQNRYSINIPNNIIPMLDECRNEKVALMFLDAAQRKGYITKADASGLHRLWLITNHTY